MTSKKKAEAIGRVLIVSKELDTEKGNHCKLQKILGTKIYFQKNGKWFYDIQRLNKKTISQLNNLSIKIKKSL
ncbi:MAG: hypothetical protein BroJett005_21830 [Ignavibacteriota bacterium]|nr:MAG: hypothetical protein BroJett005_21830 [Ignavibacteriota bacterium]